MMLHPSVPSVCLSILFFSFIHSFLHFIQTSILRFNDLYNQCVHSLIIQVGRYPSIPWFIHPFFIHFVIVHFIRKHHTRLEKAGGGLINSIASFVSRMVICILVVIIYILKALNSIMLICVLLSFRLGICL